jgi:hypothetical protein
MPLTYGVHLWRAVSGDGCSKGAVVAGLQLNALIIANSLRFIGRQNEFHRGPIDHQIIDHRLMSVLD